MASRLFERRLRRPEVFVGGGSEGAIEAPSEPPARRVYFRPSLYRASSCLVFIFLTSSW